MDDFFDVRTNSAVWSNLTLRFRAAYRSWCLSKPHLGSRGSWKVWKEWVKRTTRERGLALRQPGISVLPPPPKFLRTLREQLRPFSEAIANFQVTQHKISGVCQHYQLGSKVVLLESTGPVLWAYKTLEKLKTCCWVSPPEYQVYQIGRSKHQFLLFYCLHLSYPPIKWE